jgi:hypothetical protein
MAKQTNREYAKRLRDASQAKVMIQLIQDRMPQLSFEDLKVFPAEISDMVVSS